MFPNQIWLCFCLPPCARRKKPIINIVLFLYVTFTLHDMCTSTIIQLPQTTERKAFITLKLRDMTRKTAREREIDAPEQSSSQQLTWVIINVSTDTPFKSPPIDIFDIAQGVVHLLFHTSVMVQLAPRTSHPPLQTNTHSQTHTCAHTPLILPCRWLKWLLTFGYGFEMCWNTERWRGRWGRQQWRGLVWT